MALTACASSPDPEPLGPESVPLEEARSENPAPIAAPSLAPTPVDACPLDLAGIAVETKPVPNGMAIVFRGEEEPARARDVARRWFDSLERSPDGSDRVPVLVRYDPAEDGALVTFVPEDLEWELRHVEAVRAAFRGSADTCPIDVPPELAIVGAL